jgi:hypothetical protein
VNRAEKQRGLRVKFHDWKDLFPTHDPLVKNRRALHKRESFPVSPIIPPLPSVGELAVTGGDNTGFSLGRPGGFMVKFPNQTLHHEKRNFPIPTRPFPYRTLFAPL